jgi:chaperonin GroEL
MDISITGIKARDKVLAGANYLADAVKSTLGPFGSNILMEKGNRITNDGYTVSKALSPAIEDEFERRGALVLHEVSSKTNDQVGDATTTSIVLAQAILKEAIRQLPTESTFTSKMTPSELIRKIESEKKEILELLDKSATPITTEEALIASAKVSVENEEMAELIGKAQWAIGPDGVIIAEEYNEHTCQVEYVKGIKFDNGFPSSAFINNHEKQSVEIEDCHVIMTNYVLQNLSPLKNVIDPLIQTGVRKFAIIARGFSDDCIRVCLQNHQEGVYFYPINAPYTDQAQILKDITAVIGGTYLSQEDSVLEECTINDLGFAEKIVVRRFDTVITGTQDPAERVKVLEESLKGEVSEFEKKNINTRISQLTNGFAILKVGARTEVDRKRLKDKADDAVNAVRLALQGGTVAGAGLAFKEISENLPDGYLLKRPLMTIYNQIMSTAPSDFEIEDWVRDPVLVLRAALENACSVSSVLATVTAVVCAENPKKRKYETED